MKKFKKPLTISINQQQTANIESPKQTANQRQLLMYNQYTIASSINNQNQQNQMYQQYFQNDKQQNHLQQQEQQNDRKNNYGGKVNQNDNKNNRAKKINVVQFEQFTIHNEKHSQNNNNNMKSTLNTHNNSILRSSNINNMNNNNKRQFTIQIPENEQHKRINDFDLKSQNISNQVISKRQIKQPPCPSHKSSVNFNNKKHFIFPVHDQQKSILFKKQSQTKKTNNSLTEDEYKIKLRQINSEWQIKIQQLNKSFQKQRQQFYKQKSNLQKDLMIKDGQIQMLQKLITNRYEHKQDKIKINNTQIKINQNQQSAFPTNNNIKSHHTQQIIEDKLSKLQTILLEKDLKNTQLLQKLKELNKIIELKDEQIQTNKLTLIKQIKLTQSLKNQLFIIQRKNSNEKLTKQFYKIKQIYQVAQSQGQKLITQNSFTNSQSNNNKTSKQLYSSKQKTQLDQFLAHSKSKQKKFNKKVQNTLNSSMGQHYQNNLNTSHQNNLNQSHQMRGIDDLHRRLQSLKMNRIQLENRGKIKSQVGVYSQTTKYKPKGSFDFKGKYYQETKSYPHNRQF